MFPLPLPLNDALLKNHSFFQLYVPDGGGSFIMRELFGSFDDGIITDKILHSGVLDEFGGMEKLDLHRFEKWRTIEKSCWINRFYFLVPAARTAWLAGDRALAQTVVRAIRNFYRQEPPPQGRDALKSHWERVARRMKEDYNSRSYEEILRDETDVEYIWYDMQPAQRLVSFLYAAYFVWELIPETDKPEILDCLKLHGRVIADQESFQKPYPGNHQSLRAAAVWMVLPLLAEEPDCEEIRRTFRDLCCYHVMNEFLPSGMLYENSPSYHAFVVWHSRDFLNLARLRGETVPPEVQERFAAACRVIACCGRPDGRSLTVNDSYSYDAGPLLESLGESVEKPAFAVVKPGGIAVGTCGKCYAAMDVSSFTGRFSHYHGGKNSLTVLWNGIPFLEEAGCPSYDRPEFPLCKRPDHHTTLLTDGTGDSRQFGLYGFDGWAETEYDDGWKKSAEGCTFSSVLTSNVPEWKGIRWRRTLLLSGQGIRITDQVTSLSGKHDFQLLFCLAPDVEVSGDSPRFLLRNGAGSGEFTMQGPDPVFSAVTIPCCRKPVPRPAPQIRAEFRGLESLSCVTELRFS